MGLCAEAKGLFERRVIVELGGGVGGLLEALAGLGKVAGGERNPAEFEQPHRRQRMIELAGDDERLLEQRNGLRGLPCRRVSDAELQVDPRRRPMIGRSGPPAQRAGDIVGQRVVLTNGAHDLAASFDGQSGAADQLLHVKRRERRRRDDSALLQLRIDRELPLGDRHLLGKAAELRPTAAAAPGKADPVRTSLDHHGELDLLQPIWKGQIELDGSVVVVERVAELSHPVVALADHRVVANRIDPTRLRGFDPAAEIELELLVGLFVFAAIEQTEMAEVGLRGDRPRCRVADGRHGRAARTCTQGGDHRQAD